MSNHLLSKMNTFCCTIELRVTVLLCKFSVRQPEFCNWAFNIPRGKGCLSKWDLIPSDTDVLITHGPPVGHGDFTCSGVRAGCVELLSSVQQRIQPKYHVFGHIHEGKRTQTLFTPQ